MWGMVQLSSVCCCFLVEFMSGTWRWLQVSVSEATLKGLPPAVAMYLLNSVCVILAICGVLAARERATLVQLCFLIGMCVILAICGVLAVRERSTLVQYCFFMGISFLSSVMLQYPGMDLLNSVCVILVICGLPAVIERSTLVRLCFVMGISFLSILTLRYSRRRSSGQRPSSDFTGITPYTQVNDSLFEVYKPMALPRMYVIFFHGLQSGDYRNAHMSTWMCGDGSCNWPQKWLVDEFPHAHVFSVSYTANLEGTFQGNVDVYNIGENILLDILETNIGQAPYCPVILVGHCFGGLVIKELCNQANENFNLYSSSDLKKDKLAKFFANIRGIFCYGTPNHWSPLLNEAVDQLGSKLLKYFKTLSTEGSRLDDNFEKLRLLHPQWRVGGLESPSTNSVVFRVAVGLPEASSRVYVVEADQICRPRSKTDRRFYGLTQFLRSVLTDVKEEEEEEFRVHAKAKEESMQQNLFLPKQVIGIDVPIQEVKTKLLNSATLGLVGMGGCGKTTIAKAIYNTLVMGFEYSSYVQEVKLIPGQKDDVMEKVWSQMHHNGKKVQTEEHWSVLRSKRLLLVLDDISSDRDLEVLFDIAESSSQDSRFIVTSRDRELLKSVDDLYEVPFLNDGMAKELFMRHAFPGENAPPSRLESLVNAIVEKCDGLPLTLEVLGKYLYKRDEEEDWEQTLDSLDKAEALRELNEKLWLNLQWSVNGLQEEEQQIFFDAATFFHGNCTLSAAKVAWRAAYEHVNVKLLWRNLVNLSLVHDVEEEEVIRIHKQSLSLGRRMAEELGKTRRVCTRMEALNLLRSANELHDQEISALRLDSAKDVEFPEVIVTRSGLLSLKEVRYLHVHGNITIDGAEGDEMEPLLNNIVFPKCVGVGRQLTHLLFHSGFIRLVVLDLSYHDEEGLPSSFTELSQLKILKLSECKRLKSLPDVGRLQQLEFVEIRNCRELKELPLSFGALSRLRHLKITECRNLHTLPESFGRLGALKILQLHQCSELQTLPNSFGYLSSLEHLELQCDLHALPESFGFLCSLRYLKFLYCNSIRTLPDSFGSLSALDHLEFNSCHSLGSLPYSFGLLSRLRSLQFTECPMLHTLPESFGNLSALTELQFTECPELHSLPKSLGDLSGLSDLQFRCCDKLDTLPESFGRLSSLQHLQLEQCDTLCALPKSFNLLMKLESLKISFCFRMKMLPESFAELIALRHLIIEMVALTTVPDSIFRLSSLEVLEVGILPFVKELPPWWGGPEAGLQMTSRKIFHVRDGNSALAEVHDLESGDQWRVICGVHRRAMDLVKGSKFGEALATLNACNAHVSELQLQPRLLLFGASYKPIQLQVFFLQERGISKRLAGDLVGALEDLNSAFEVGSSRSFPHFRKEHRYDCLKHRAYVKYLQGDQDGAGRDAHEALSIRGGRCDGSESTPGRKDYLGDDSVKFLDFQLK